MAKRGKFDPDMVSDIATRLAEYFMYLIDIAELMWLVRESIGAIGFVNELHQRANTGTEDEHKAVSYAEIASVARRTKALDFSLLHGNSLVGIWGATEAVIEDIAVLWIAAQNDSHSLPAFAKIKLPVTDLLGRDRKSQARSLVAELQRQERADSQFGIGQFEALLDPVGLGGAVEEQTRRQILAAQQTRHLIAHRNSIADELFVKRCPWLGKNVGERVAVSGAEFAAYLRACGAYVQVVVDRLIERASETDPWVRESFEAAKVEAGDFTTSDQVRDRLDAARERQRSSGAPEART